MKESTNQIKAKQVKLEKAADLLKSEFFGIDKCIDEIIHYLEPWYYYPELQERPTVINLWGMTGTGKTELIRKLMSYLDLDDVFFHSEASAIVSDHELQHAFSEIFRKQTEKQTVICLDEFQFLGKNLSGIPKNGQQPQKLWSLLDSGQIEFIEFEGRYSELKEFSERLRAGISLGVKVKKGMVVRKASEFLQLGKLDPFVTKLKRDNTEVIDVRLLDALFEYTKDEWEGYYHFMQVFQTFNESEILDLAEKVLRKMRRPRKYDASRSVIFIIGNLDKAYGMSGNMNPDEDADHFYRHSLKLSLIDIKESLRSTFRSEQISRLGNNHVIYPALSSEAFRSILANLLFRAGEKLSGKIGIDSEFHDSLIDHLYQESVFPTQGVRPLISSVRSLIEGNFARVTMELDKLPVEPTTLHWYWSKGMLIVEGQRAENKDAILKIPATESLKDLRSKRNSEIQSLVATHESGHAILAIHLLKKLPEQVISASVMKNSYGYVKLDMEDFILNKQGLTHYLAYLLGGRVAEKMVFGDAYISMGSESDLHEATKLASAAIYKSGMGGMTGAFAIFGNELNNYMQAPDHLSEKVKALLDEAELLAADVLSDQLKDMATLMDHLSKNPSITREGLAELLNIQNLQPVRKTYQDALNSFVQESIVENKKIAV